MANSYPGVVTGSSIGVVIRGKVYTVDRSNPHANMIYSAIKNHEDEDSIIALFDLAAGIGRFLNGAVEVRDGAVLYKGELVDNVVADRIIQFMQDGLDARPLVKFLENLMLNPSRNSVKQLYAFLEKEGLPITTDGNFLAYKGVSENWYSISSGPSDVVEKGVVNSSGHIRNQIGDVVKMTRNYVCDNPGIHCSHGLHAGSFKYAASFGPRVVLVEINPRDCVSVPSDCNCEKLRVCEYKVVAECQGLLRGALVINSSEPYKNLGLSWLDKDVEDRGPFTVETTTEAGDVIGTYENLTWDDMQTRVDTSEEADLEFVVRDARGYEVTELI